MTTHQGDDVRSPSIRPLMARTVARELTQHLELSNTSVYWVGVVGEDSLQSVPATLWPSNDPMLNLMLCQGHSEGMLVYVMAQANRYQPEEVTALLRIKMLGSYTTVCAELPFIWEFLDRLDQLREPSPTAHNIEAVTG